MSQRTLLGVWAHPDDEAYLSAGLMAEFRERGDRVVMITATLGEHGTDDPALWPPDVLAALREVELRNALRAVGVNELRLLGYEDGTLDSFDTTDGCDLLTAHIRDIEPDLIVTFGPEGMTGHPDHQGHQPVDHGRVDGDRVRVRALVRHADAELPSPVGWSQRRGRAVERPTAAAVHRARRAGADVELAR